MPSNYTPNYQLNQWEASDRVLRTDFNADNAKIDGALAAQAEALENEKTAREAAVKSINTALAGALKMAAGSYAGNGAETRTIFVGFTPKAVYVVTREGYAYYGSGSSFSFNGGLAVTGQPAGNPYIPAVEIVDGGFRVRVNSDNRVYTNQSQSTYNYVAFG